LKPEIQLLLSMISDGVRAPAALTPEQSASFLALCRHHRVDSYLGHHVQNNRCPALPEETSRKMIASLHGAKLRARRMLENFQRVANDLHRNGIEFAALKGIDLSARIYDDPGLRTFDDIDILVRGGDVSRVLEVLARIGFETPARLLPASWVRKYHFHLPLVHKEEKWMLEVHWRLMDQRILPDVGEEELWDSMRRSPAGYRILSPVHYVAYLAAHAAKHGILNRRIAVHPRCSEFLLHPYSEIRLIWLIDIARLMAVEKVSPEDALATAADWGCGDSAGDIQAFCNTLFSSDSKADGSAEFGRREGIVERQVKVRLMNKMQQELDGEDPCAESLPWLLVPNKTFHVRPIRLLTHG